MNFSAEKIKILLKIQKFSGTFKFPAERISGFCLGGEGVLIFV
jgi:hypothetical protein